MEREYGGRNLGNTEKSSFGRRGTRERNRGDRGGNFSPGLDPAATSWQTICTALELIQLLEALVSGRVWRIKFILPLRSDSQKMFLSEDFNL